MQEIIKKTLEELFGKVVQVGDKILKVSFKELKGNDIWNLTEIYSKREVKEVVLKRSNKKINVTVELF
jgi:hypothetical protein